MISFLDYQILFTLAYTKQFNYPLFSQEIFKRLVSASLIDTKNQKTKANITSKKVDQALIKLLKQNLLIKENGMFCLKGSKASFETREKRNGFSVEIKEDIKDLKNLAVKFKWIKAIAVTGAVAMNNAKENDDIDFFVVTTKNRLWLVRLMLLLAAILKRKKKIPKISKLKINCKEKKQHNLKLDSWDFNLWLDEAKLEIVKERRNLYTAYEVCQAKWLYDKAGIEKFFLLANSWVEDYLPNYYASLSEEIEVRSKKLGVRSDQIKAKKDNLENQKSVVCCSYLDKLNLVAFQVQTTYLNKKLGLAKVNMQPGFAFLHLSKRRIQIIKKLAAILEERGISLIYTQYSSHQLNFVPKFRVRSENMTKKTIVLATGVFDLLHAEHINFLKKAKEAGDILLVGIESDKRVRELKGEGRPYQDQQQRSEGIKKLDFAAAVFILPENFGEAEVQRLLIEEIKPDVLAVSSHTPHLEKKKKILQEFGAKVVIVHQYNPETSTTQLLNNRLV